MTRVPRVIVALAFALAASCDSRRAVPADSAARIVDRTRSMSSDTAIRPVDVNADTLWLLADDPTRDGVRAADSRADLVRRFGGRNVVDDTILLGEGFTTHGTVLFARDPLRRLEVIWKDSVGMSLPDRAVVAGERSRWVIFPGLSIGTCVEEIESLNARPFTLFGFGWDHGGTLHGWDDGRLDSVWTPQLVSLRFRPTADVPDLELITGERVFSSDQPGMRKARPCVREIVVRPR